MHKEYKTGSRRWYGMQEGSVSLQQVTTAVVCAAMAVRMFHAGRNRYEMVLVFYVMMYSNVICSSLQHDKNCAQPEAVLVTYIVQ